MLSTDNNKLIWSVAVLRSLRSQCWASQADAALHGVAIQSPGNLWPAGKKLQSTRAVRRRKFIAAWLFQELTFSPWLHCFSYIMEVYSQIFWHNFIFHKGKKEEKTQLSPTWLLGGYEWHISPSFFSTVPFFSCQRIGGCFSDKKINPGTVWGIIMGCNCHLLESYSYNC